MTIRLNQRVVWAVIGFVLASLLWMLNVELTYQQNLQDGLPANFNLDHRHPVGRWRT